MQNFTILLLPTIIYNSTPSTPYTISWLLLEPCITESQKPSERKSHLDLAKKTLTLNGFLLDLPISFLRVKPTSQLVLNKLFLDSQPYPTSKVSQTKSSEYFWKPVFKWRSNHF